MKITKISVEDLEKAKEVAKSALHIKDQVQRYRTVTEELRTRSDKASKGFYAILSDPSKADQVAESNQDYAKAVSLLKEAREIASEINLFRKTLLFEEKLPDIVDVGPTENKDQLTKELQERVQVADRLKGVADEVISLINRLQPYVGLVGEASQIMDNTGKCFNEWEKQAGKEPLGNAEACNELHDKIKPIIEKLKQAAQQPDFSSDEDLSYLRLPNFKEGSESSQDPKTKEFWQIVEKLEQASQQAKEVVDEAQKLEAIASEIYSLVNETVISTLDGVVKYAVLSAAGDGATDDAAVQAGKEQGLKFIDDLVKQSNEIVDKILES